MRIPKVKKRRLYDHSTYGFMYSESDTDFVKNNLDACIWFLENRDKINEIIKGQKNEVR
jgi:hypothetical protein